MSSSKVKFMKENRFSPISCCLPEMKDTTIVDDDIREIVSRLRKLVDEAMSIKIVESGLLEAAGFLDVIPCPELAIEFRNRYCKAKRCIKIKSGEVLVNVDRTVIMTTLRIPPVEIYGD